MAFFFVDLAIWLSPAMGMMEKAAFVVTATIIFSAATYLAVERPMMRLGARLATRAIKRGAVRTA